ncbi:MAG: hypothetical protein JW828_07025 [Sedimentisphaerales bacterium]|nr:hypothetical protein [Sedimentisphaerales bacterium]
MKQSPDMKKLEEVLRSGRIVHGGFLGTDSRRLIEIIETDLAAVERLGLTCVSIAKRMLELTEAARPRYGAWMEMDDYLSVRCEDVKGSIVCPWPHAGRFVKRITTAHRRDLDQTISWTDLNIHMIAEHGFFEGKGSFFRLEPEQLAGIIFPASK